MSEDVCFVIGPIGDTGSDIRKRSDQIMRYVVDPVATTLGFQTLRGDTIAAPGMITSQIITHILESPMVIADLTGRNPNVYYELALRHAVRKPVVHIAEVGEQLPFDVAGFRTIWVNHRDLDSVEDAKKHLMEYIKSARLSGAPVDSPVSTAVDIEMMRKSGSEEGQHMAQVLSTLALVHSKLSDPGNLFPTDYFRQTIRQEFLYLLSIFVTDSTWYTRRTYVTGDVQTASDMNELARGGFTVDSLKRIVEQLSQTAKTPSKRPRGTDGHSNKAK